MFQSQSICEGVTIIDGHIFLLTKVKWNCFSILSIFFVWFVRFTLFDFAIIKLNEKRKLICHLQGEQDQSDQSIENIFAEHTKLNWFWDKRFWADGESINFRCLQKEKYFDYLLINQKPKWTFKRFILNLIKCWKPCGKMLVQNGWK